MSGIFTDAVLLRSLVLFLLLGSVVGLLAGATLLLRPQWLQRISKQGNRWVSTRQMGRTLEAEVNMDHWLYRYGHLSGIVLIAGGGFIIAKLTGQLARAEMLLGLSQMQLVQPVLIAPLLDTLVLLFLAGAVAAIIIGLFLIFRPSMLKDMELGANQNVSMRQSLKPLEIQRGKLDELVFSHGKLVGITLLCTSTYALVVLLGWLLR